MLSTLFWVLLGVVIGWIIPQPTWAKELFEKCVDAIKKKINVPPAS